MATGIDWSAVRSDLDAEEWVFSEENGQYERIVFLGTVFALYPSGKYYMPFACSNLAPCSRCGGSGNIVRHKRRLINKWRNAEARFQRLCDLRGRGPGSWAARHSAYWHFYRKKIYALCPDCGGMGSREAYLDELYQEELESEASDHDLFITSGEGDPCDILVGECKDKVTCSECGAEEGSSHECVQEGDITTEDHCRFYQDGKLVLEIGVDDDHVAALKAFMDREQFWPNAFFISDHGNAHRIVVAVRTCDSCKETLPYSDEWFNFTCPDCRYPTK